MLTEGETTAARMTADRQMQSQIIVTCSASFPPSQDVLRSLIYELTLTDLLIIKLRIIWYLCSAANRFNKHSVWLLGCQLLLTDIDILCGIMLLWYLPLKKMSTYPERTQVDTGRMPKPPPGDWDHGAKRIHSFVYSGCHQRCIFDTKGYWMWLNKCQITMKGVLLNITLLYLDALYSIKKENISL